MLYIVSAVNGFCREACYTQFQLRVDAAKCYTLSQLWVDSAEGHNIHYFSFGLMLLRDMLYTISAIGGCCKVL